MSVLIYFHRDDGSIKKIRVEIKLSDGDCFTLTLKSIFSGLKLKNLLRLLKQSLKARERFRPAERVTLSLFEVTEQEKKQLFKKEIDKNRIREIISVKAKKFFPQPA